MIENNELIEVLAAACHSAWYSYTVIGLGEPGQPWHRAPEWQRDSIRDGVKLWIDVVNGPRCPKGFDEAIRYMAPLSHESWIRYKEKEGWRYGSEKDEQLKTHPCMVPYKDLPAAQQKKDAVVISAFLSMYRVFLGLEAKQNVFEAASGKFE